MKQKLSRQLKNLSLAALMLVGAGFLSSSLEAYVTRLDILKLGVNGNPSDKFTTIDPFISVRMVSYFCVEDQNPTGNYTFTLRITNPKGVVVKEIKTPVKTTPGTSQMIQQDFASIPLSFLTELGTYRVYGSFDEEYTTGKKLSFTNTGFFEIKDAGFSTTLFSSNLTLVQPANKAVLAMQRPFFQWAYNANVAKYSIYVGKGDNPKNLSIWKAEGLSTNFIQYPANVPQLEFGEQYTWQVVGLDQLGRPIGGNLGASEVYSFYLGNGDGSTIILIGPKDSQKVEFDHFYFSWEGLYGEHSYELELASDSGFNNIIWTGNTSETSIMYPVSAPELLVGQEYFWRTKVVVSGFFNLALSETAKFIFDRKVTDVITPPTLGSGKSGLVGLVKGQFGNPLEGVYVSIEGPLSFGANKINYNVATDSLGRYSQELNPGTYKVKFFKSLHKQVEEEVVIEPAKALNKDITLFDQGTILTGTILNSVTGEGIAGVSVTLKNFFSEVKTITSESGTYSFSQLLPGSFVIETDYPPFFEPQNVEITLQRGSNDKNIYLKGKRTGVLYGKVNKSADGTSLEPIIMGDIKIRALELDGNSSAENIGVSQAETSIVAGKFEQIDLKPGLYEVIADTALFAPQRKTVQIQAGSISNIDFVISTKKYEVTGRVLNDTGNAVSNANVQIKNKPAIGGCSTDMFGGFKCLFYEGEHELQVSAMSYENSYKKIQVKGNLNVGNVLIESEKGNMEISVKDSTGNAVVGAKIRLINSNKAQSFPTTEPVSDSNGKFATIRLPYFSFYEIEVYHPSRVDFEKETATLWMQKEGSEVTTVKHNFVLMKTVQLQGLVQSESMSPLANASVSIPGTSYSAISGLDGRFSIKFPLLDPEPDSLTVNVSRAGFYPERRQVSPGVLSVPLVVRLIDEQKKIASFTNVMLNNSMLDVRTGLDDLINWVNWAVARILSELEATNALYLEYKAAIDLILNEINSKRQLIVSELQKPFITVQGLQLSVQLKELNDRIKILVDAMRIKITKRLNDTEAFLKLVQATASVTIPEIQMKISDIKESIQKSPFIDEVQREVLNVSAISQEIKFNTEVKTFYETKSVEIENKFEEIKTKILNDVKITEDSIEEGKKLVEDFLAHIKTLSESGGNNGGGNNSGPIEVPSLTEIIKFFGVEFKLDYVRVQGNTTKLDVKGTVTLRAQENSLPANLGFEKLELPIVINGINTPFQNKTLKTLVKFIKTEEFSGPIASAKELQDLYPQLNETERGILLGAGIATAAAASTYIIQNREQLFDKILMIAATELSNGIEIIPANQSKVLVNLGYYDLVLKGLSAKASGTISSARLEIGSFALVKSANPGTTIALPQSLALENVVINANGKIDFSKALVKLNSGDFSFNLPGMNAAIAFDGQSSLELVLSSLKLTLKNMAVVGNNGQVRVTAVFFLKPFKVHDVQINSKPISLSSLADIKSLFNVKFNLDYVRAETGGQVSVKGTLRIESTPDSLPAALGFTGKDFPITLSKIQTPFQETTLKTLVKFIKTPEYMGAPPTEDELMALYPNFNNVEKAVFLSAAVTSAGAAATYIISNRQKLLEQILAKIANNFYIVPEDKEEKLLAIGPYDFIIKGLYLSGNGTIESTKLNLSTAQLKLDTARYSGSVNLPGVIALENVNVGTDGKIDFSKATASITATNIALTIPGVNGSIDMDQESSVELLLSSTLLKLKEFAVTNLTTGQSVRANVDIQLNPFGIARVEIGGQQLTSLADVAKMFGVKFALDYIKPDGTDGKIQVAGRLTVTAEPGSLPTVLGFDSKEIPLSLRSIPTPFQYSTLELMLRFIKSTENNGVAPSQEELLAHWPKMTKQEKFIFGGAATVAAGAGVAYVIKNKDTLWDKVMAIIAKDIVIVPENEQKVIIPGIGPYDLVASGMRLTNPGATDIETLNIAQLIASTKISMDSFGFKRNNSDIGALKLPGFIGINNVSVTGNGNFDFSAAVAYLKDLNISLTIPGLNYTVATDSQTRVELKIADLTMDIVDLALSSATSTAPLRATLRLGLKPFKIIELKLGSTPVSISSLLKVHEMFGVKFELDSLKAQTGGKLDLKGTAFISAKTGSLPETLGFTEKAFPIDLKSIPTPFSTDFLALAVSFIKTKENEGATAPSTQDILAVWSKLSAKEKTILAGSATLAASAAAAVVIEKKDDIWSKLVAVVADGIELVKSDKNQNLIENIGPYNLVVAGVKLSNSGVNKENIDIAALVSETKVVVNKIGFELKSDYSGSLGLPKFIGIKDVVFANGKLDFSDAKAAVQEANFAINIPGINGSIGMDKESSIDLDIQDLKLDFNDFALKTETKTSRVDAEIFLKPFKLGSVTIDGQTLNSLSDIVSMFGVRVELQYVKTQGTEGKIGVRAKLYIDPKDNSIAQNAGIEIDPIQLELNNIPTPFRKQTLDVVLRFLKTEENNGVAPTTEELQALYSSLNNAEKAILYGGVTAGAVAGAAYVIQNKADLWKKLLAIIASGIEIVKDTEEKAIIKKIGPYDLVISGFKLTNNGGNPETLNIAQLISDTKWSLKSAKLKKRSDFTNSIAIPNEIKVENLVVTGDGKLDFTNTTASIEGSQFALQIPGFTQTIGMDAQSKVTVALKDLILEIKDLALTNTQNNSVSRANIKFSLSPFKLLDFNIGGQSINSLADVTNMFGVKFNLKYIKTVGTEGRFSIAGTALVEAKPGTVAQAIGFNGKEIPLALNNLKTPFQTNTLNVLFKFIKTEEYMGMPPSQAELEGLWSTFTATEKLIFGGAATVAAGAGAAYVIANKDDLWKKLLAVVANEVVIADANGKTFIEKIGPYDLVAKNVKLSNNGTPQPESINIVQLIQSTQLSIGELGFKLRSDYAGQVQLPGYVGINSVVFDGSGKLDFSNASVKLDSTTLKFGIPGKGTIELDNESSALFTFADAKLSLNKFALKIGDGLARVNAEMILKPFELTKLDVGGVDVTNISLADVAAMFGVTFDLDYIKPGTKSKNVALKGKLLVTPKAETLASALKFNVEIPIELANIPTPFETSTLAVVLRLIKSKENVAGAPTEKELLDLWPSLTATEKLIIGGTATVAAGAGVAYAIANKDKLWDKLMAIVANGLQLVPKDKEEKLFDLGPYEFVMKGLSLSNPGAGNVETLNIGQLITSTKLNLDAAGLKLKSGYTGAIALPQYVGITGIALDKDGVDFSKATAILEGNHLKFGIPGQAEIGMTPESTAVFTFSDRILDLKKFQAVIAGSTVSVEATLRFGNPVELVKFEIGGIDPTNMSLADITNMFGIEWDLNYVKRGTNNKSVAVSAEVRLMAKPGSIAQLLTAKLASQDGYLLKKTVTFANLPTPFRNELLDLLTKMIKTKENVISNTNKVEVKEVWEKLNNAERAFIIALGAGVTTAVLTNGTAAELADQAVDSFLKAEDKAKIWSGLLANITGGINLFETEDDLVEIGPYKLVLKNLKIEHNGNTLPETASIATLIPTAKQLIESVKVNVGDLGLRLKAGQNQKLPNYIGISNVNLDIANGLDFSNASVNITGTNLSLDLPPMLAGGSIGLDSQSAVTFSFKDLILDIKDIKVSNANNSVNRLGVKISLDPFKFLDLTVDGLSLMGNMANIAKMFNVKFDLDYIKPGTQNKKISFKGLLTFEPKEGSLLANMGFKGKGFTIQKDNFPFILENSTTAVLVKYIQTKEYPGPAPSQQELLDLWPQLTNSEKAIFTSLGVAAAAGAVGYFATNKDKLLEMLLALVENDIELVPSSQEKELYDKNLGPYKLVAKGIVLKKQQGVTVTNIMSLINSMKLEVGSLGLRFVSGSNTGSLSAIPQYIGISGVSLSTSGMDFSNAVASVDMGTFSLGVNGYAGIGTDTETKVIYSFADHTLNFNDFKVELFGVPNRLTVRTEVLPTFKVKEVKILPSTSGGGDPCANGGVDPATGSPIVNVNNPEQLQLALKITDIQNHANAIKAVLGDAVNHVNDVPNTMGPFYTLVMQINQNLEKAKNAIDLLDNKIGQLIDTFNVTKDFVGNFHKNFHINQIKGIDANLTLRTVEGEKLKFYLSGTVTIKETRDLPSFTIPIPDIKIDASKFLGSDAVGNFLTKMRDASTKMKDFLKEHLSALQNLVTDSGVSNLKSMIPSALLNFTGNFLPQEIKDTDQYTEQIPSSITNFSAASVFPEWLLTFNFCTIPEAERELIKTTNAYEYVYSKLPTYLQSLVPSQELNLKNLNKDFLVKEFFPTAITDIVNAIKSGDSNKIAELVMSALPEQLLPMAQATFNMLKNGMNDSTVSDFVKVFLDQALREYLPANFFTMLLDDITPNMLKNFKPNEFLAKMKDNVKNLLDPEFVIKKDGAPLSFTFGDLEKHPFGVTLTNIALGYEPSKDKAYLGADMIVKFGDKIKRTIKQMPDEARMNGIRIYEDASTSLTELIITNLNINILGFDAQIQKFVYNFAQTKIGMEGKFKFKLLGEERTLTVQDFAIQKVSGKWEVAALDFQLSPPVKVSALELSSLSFDSPNKLLNFGGRLVSTDSRLREIQLGSIKFQDGRLIEASASFSNLEFNLYSKVKIGIESVDVSIKDSFGEEEASFRVKMLNSSIKFGDFKDQENPSTDYSIAVGLIDVYWRSGQKLDFQFDDVNITLKPFDFKAFVFHVKKFTINKVRDGGSMVTQMRIHVRVEIPIPGADNGGANSVESSWVFTEGQPVRLERLQLDLNIKGNRIKGILVNEPAYLYAAVDIQLSGGFRAYGEFFRQDRNNWRITAHLTFPSPIILFSVGVVAVGVKGGGLTVGEREGDLFLGLAVDIVVLAGSALTIFDGTVSITFFFGQNLLRITGSGTLNLSEQISLGPVYAELNLQFAGADSYMTALVIANPTIAGMIEASAQMNMDVRRQYFTLAFAVGAQIKVLGIKVGLSAGMQFAIGLSQNAPMSPLIVYNGLLYTLPADIKAGLAFFFDGYASISTADFGIPSGIIQGSLTLQGGVAVTLDFGKGLFNGGAFAKVLGSVSLLSVLQASIGLSVDMAAQIGKKTTYFVGQAAFQASVTVAGIHIGSVNEQFVVKFGQVPAELLTLANAPANMQPNQPKGALSILVRDPFGVPVKDMDISVTNTANASMKSLGKTNNAGEYLTDRMNIYDSYTIVATDPNGKFVMDVICDPQGENCTQGSAHVPFNFSGQTYFVKLVPTTPLMDISVKVEKPTDAQVSSEALKGMRIRVTDKNTNMDMDEVTQDVAVDQLKVGSLTKYSAKNVAGFWANVTQIFIQPNSNTKFKISVIPKAESEYDETVVDNVEFATLTKVVNKTTNLELNNSRHMKINLQFKKIILEGKVSNLAGDGIADADVELYYNNALQTSVKTNVSGKYSIPNLKPFDYEIKVKKANYIGTQKSLKLTPLSRIQDFTLEESRSQIFAEAKDVTGAPLSGIQFMVGGGNEDNCTTDSTGKCELKKISVGKSYTMKLPQGDAKIISMDASNIATYDVTTRQVSFTTTTVVNETFKVKVQNGPKLYGKFVNNENEGLEVLASELKITNEANAEISGVLKAMKPDGSFELYFPPVTSVTKIKFDIAKSGANRIVREFTMEPMGQKPEQALGNIVLSTNPVKQALAGRVITSAGGYKLRITEDLGKILDSTDSVQHFANGEGQVLLVSGELFFESSADFKANGSIEFNNVKIEAKFAANGKDVDVHLVTDVLGGPNSNLTSNQLPVKIFGLSGLIRDVEVDLKQNGLVKGKPSILLQNEIPLLNCDVSMTFDSNENIAKVDASGNVTFTMPIGDEKVFKIRDASTCLAQGPKFEINATESLKVVYMGTSAASKYKMKLTGYVLLPKINNQSGFSRLGGNDAKVSILLDVTANGIQVSATGQADVSLIASNVMAILEGSKSVDHKVKKIVTTATGILFEYAQVLPKDSNNPIAQWKNGSITFDANANPVIGPAAEPNTTSEQVNVNVNVNGQIKQYKIDKKDLKMFFNKATGQRFMGIEENKSTQQ